MSRPDLVLFDCDGVLVDSEPISMGVLRDDLALRGLDLPVARIEALFVGGTLQDDIEIARRMGAVLPDDWDARIQTVTFAALRAECRIVNGITAVLDALDAAGIGFAVCSNGSIAKMHVTLSATGLLPRFEGCMYSVEDCAAPKPAPDVYLKVATEAGIAPERCVVIEDSATGARAGQAAGMVVYGFANGGPREKLAPHCTAMFDDLDQLTRLLGV